MGGEGCQSPGLCPAQILALFVEMQRVEERRRRSKGVEIRGLTTHFLGGCGEKGRPPEGDTRELWLFPVLCFFLPHIPHMFEGPVRSGLCWGEEYGNKSTQSPATGSI